MVVCLPGCKEQQSSLHAPWAQVCNESRSTAITQNLCLSTHREPNMQVFSCIFWCVCIHLLLLSVPNEAIQCVWGGGSGGSAKGREAGGCWEKTWFVFKRSDDLNFRFRVKIVCDGLLLVSFVIFLEPRRTTRVKHTCHNPG